MGLGVSISSKMGGDMSEPRLDPRLAADLRRAEWLARVSDDWFKIPVLGTRVGLDSLIGLIPGAGDIIGLAFSIALFVTAIRIGAPGRVLALMVFNMLIDFLAGTVPVVGDVFDVVWRANRRNRILLKAVIASRR